MMAFAGYQLTEKLYEGSGSRVYRGYRDSDRQPVILKILKQDYPTPDAIARFQLEYQITRTLYSSGVAQAYNLEQCGHQWVMVLEDFGGVSLSQLTKTQTFTLPQTLTLSVRLVEILGEIHQQGVIHKDINPSNIVVNPTTGQVKIIDFGISEILLREHHTFSNPHILEGTLPYVSPEQTGRMNRSLDYRTDFYSLGVTLYELFTRQRPFTALDALELVHCHLAKQPIPPHERQSGVPLAISQIILKLMAKMAEDRYQNATGIRADLAECLQQLQNTGSIQSFPLGRHDVTTQLQIPQKLYNREAEIETLLAAFARVCGKGEEKHSELLLVCGYAGIGKSALVRELYKPMTQHRGYLITGKFEQYQRNIPYFGIAIAFSQLIQQLLTEPEHQLQQWREQLQTALGSNAQVLIEVIPEIVLLLGQQPKVPLLGATEAQNRFNLVFERFVQVFAQPQHPLILFLDDLQWADWASLKLLYRLMTRLDQDSLLVIGAYRDREVNSTHPLTLTLKDIQQAGGRINQIKLKPLDGDCITKLLADTLHCRHFLVQPLALLLQQKTGGNPFFLKEFIRTLYVQGLIYFNRNQGCWQWHLGEIQAKDITNNVVELLVRKIELLEPQTQKILKLAACMGNQFNLYYLASLYQRPLRETAADLQEAIFAGLLIPVTSSYQLMALGIQERTDVIYKFVHDRIQQATYDLIPLQERTKIHYQISHLFLETLSDTEQEQRLFEVVNQLNLGRELVIESPEKYQLIRLNWLAGEKAKASNAYDSACQYFQIGLEFLGSNCWQNSYDLTLSLYLDAAEANYLNGDFERMEQLSAIILKHCKNDLDCLKIYEIQIQAYCARIKFLEALKLALQVLEKLGCFLPEQPSKAEIEKAISDTQLILENRKIESFVDLPLMTHSQKLAIMRILSSAISPAYIAAPSCLIGIVCQQVRLSIESGNAASSSFAYAMYGLILCGFLNEIETGYQFGELALQVLDKMAEKPLIAKTVVVVATNIKPWKVHFKETLILLQEAYQTGLDYGDLEFSGYAAINGIDYAYYGNQELSELQKTLVGYIQNFKKLKQARNVEMLEMYLQAVLNLREKVAEPHQLQGQAYQENERLRLLQQNADRHALFHFHLHKLFLSCLFEEEEMGLKEAKLAESYLDGVIGLGLVAVFYFYDSLMQLAYYRKTSLQDRDSLIQKVSANQEKLRFWAEHAPMNYQHKFLLVEAEYHRVLGDDLKAAELYDQAINLAEASEYLQEAALAYELAAKFYCAKGKNAIAKAYLQESRYSYLRWGATAKVQALEQRYPECFSPIPASPPLLSRTVHSTSNGSAELDLVTVMKASQAIASELVLERLLSILLKVAIENAGAQTGWLILASHQQLQIEATGSADCEVVEVMQPIPIEQSSEVCVAIVHYVVRTQTSLVLSDAVQDERFLRDTYILQKQPKSILCTPLVNQGQLLGVLYLENNLTSNAFSPRRVELINLLSTQMAIALENARLLKQQAELNTSLQREREQISRILQRIADGFIAMDREGKIIYVNQRAEEQLGKTGSELLSQNFWEVYPEAMRSTIDHYYQEVIETGKPTHFEVFYSPSQRWLEISAYPDQEGLSAFFKDITERKNMEEKLVHDALHDALTGLPNRLLLTKKLEQTIRQAKTQSNYRFAVLFLDVDRFKVINDSLGHLVGDELLIAIARRLETCITPQDTIARLGGDEFIILLDHPTDEARIAARIQMTLNVPFDLNGYKVFNTVSIGIVSSATGYDRPEELLKAADIAMYQAKAAGKARYVVFDTPMQERATSLLKLETELRWAIEREQLRVHYQPIVALKTGKLAGFEALVRWLHPEQGLVPPSKFIPLAEETGLIVAIGQWVFSEACHQLQIWQQQFSQQQALTMGINLSVKQFSQSDLIEFIDATLSQLNLRGEQLKLEITESALIENPERTRELLLELRSRHIQLCIDDFGTGYSSLSYLHQFPVDILKIDRSFIWRLGGQNRDAELVRTILALANSLTIDAIAEGIETTDQLAELRNFGCGFGQGYYFAKPLDTPAATHLIAQAPQW